MLIKHNIEKLNEIKQLMLELPSELFLTPIDIISNATIGQHFRHILEFYSCLEKGVSTGVVCYDERERNVLIETNIEYAIRQIEERIAFLKSIKMDGVMKLKANYSTLTESKIHVESSIYRELAYAMDHAVHHLAIVKIALCKGGGNTEIIKNLGVAPSTIRHRDQFEQ